MDNIYIDIDGIHNVANNLSNKNEELNKYYKNVFLAFTSNIEENMDESYIVYHQSIKKIKTDFLKIFETLEALLNILNKDVINSYDESLEYIKHLFNDELNKEILDLLNDKMEYLDL